MSALQQTREQLLEEAFAVAEQVSPLSADIEGAAVAVAHELRALRLTLAAAIAVEEKERFEQWAQISLMGHTDVVGLVREISIGGRAFLEVVIPAGPAGTKRMAEEPFEAPEERRIYSTSAVYAIEPMPELRVRALLVEARAWNTPPASDDIPF